MNYEPHFWLSLASLSIILVYVVLVFRNIDPLIAIAIGVILGFVFNHSSPIQIGQIFSDALGSFLALVGFIIMLGRGLGQILFETKVSQNLVHKIVHSIGINTTRRFKIGVIISSIFIVSILGTLAGGLAILAPVLRPIAARVGLSKPSLAVLMQASGEEGLILGPFAPPVLTLLGVTHLSYITVLIWASIPIAIVTLSVSWIMANRFQKIYKNELHIQDINYEDFTPNRRQNITTLFFILAFIFCLIYGLYNHVHTSYVVFVMLFLSISTGIVGGLNLTQIFELIVTGMKDSFHLFFMFLLLDPFLALIEKAGGFNALMQLFKPLEHIGGKPMVAIITGLTGAFGMPAASEAVIKLLNSMFLPLANNTALNPITFAFSILLATRIINFAYPGPNMFAAMGFAGSDNIKAMIKNGLMVTLVQVIFLIIYSLIFS